MGYAEIIFHYIPVNQRRFVILRDWGLGYGCNPKYLCQYIIKNHLPFELIWLVNYYDDTMPKEIKQVRLSRISAVYYLSTAQVVVSTAKFRIPVKKKNEQYFVYIPHGQAGAKPCLDEIPLKDDFRQMAMEHSAIQDLFVASSEFQAKDFIDFYWCNCEILRSGYPRNDIYFQNNTRLSQQIRQTLSLPDNYSIVFYAPTFRDNGDASAYSIDLNRVILALENKTGQDWLVLVRLHPNLRYWYKKPEIQYSERIRDVTDYPDIQELFLISDVVITDYSSTMFDFALTRKPVFLFATDVDEYIQMRGLKDMFFKTPFPLCRNNDELEQVIGDFNDIEYQKKLDKFNAVYKPLDDGHASERIINKINQAIGKK